MKNYPIQLSAFIAIRDVEKYIEEWINFYLLVGVQHFVIYDYGSKDNTPELIRPYIKRGIIDYRYFTPRYISEFKNVDRWFELLSLTHRLEVVNEYKTICKWMCFFDIDEFTFPFDENKGLLDILQKYEEFAALHVNWVMFGDSGEKEYKNDYVINRFNKRAPLDWPDNEHCKVICRPDRVDLDHSAESVNPHYFFYKKGFRGVNENNETVGMDKKINQEIHKGHSAFSPNPENRKVIRCNHYHFKSIEEYNNKRKKHISGGLAYQPKAEEIHFLFNKEEDNLIKRYIPLLNSINLHNYSL